MGIMGTMHPRMADGAYSGLHRAVIYTVWIPSALLTGKISLSNQRFEMEMIYSLLVFVKIAAIKFRVQSEYLTLRVCARTSQGICIENGKLILDR